jgi:predicted MFS family arabinose efflux permease
MSEGALPDAPVANAQPTLERAVVTATSAEAHQSTADLRRYATLILVGVFCTTLARENQLAALPVRSLLKDHLHVSPDMSARFLAIAALAWYLKPLAGILSDCVPLFGTRRRHYLILSSFGGMLLWLLAGFVPREYGTLLVVLVAMNVMGVMASTVVGGMLVDQGRKRSATGRLSAIRLAVMNLCPLIAGLAGGYLAGLDFRVTTTTAAALMMALFLVASFLMQEKPERLETDELRRRSFQQLRTLFRSGALWATVALTFLHYVVPGLNTLFYYYQKDVVRLSDAQIGLLTMTSGAFAIAGSLTYGAICRHFNLRTLLAAGMTLNAVATLFYIFYRSFPTAFAVEAASAFVGTLGLLPLYDLAARATPRGCEALGYSIIMSIGNFGIGLSDVGGTLLSKHYQLSFANMVYINSATTALILVFIPFLPRMLVLRREGEAAPQAGQHEEGDQ